MTANKMYMTAEEIIERLKNKNLAFSQPVRAKRLLIENNYYVISAYRKLFYDDNKQFKSGVDFEHLFAIYTFDKEFKMTVLKHLLLIEQKIKSAISNEISPKYGINEEDYLKRVNYNQVNPYLDQTINKLNNQISLFGKKNSAVSHYKNKHGFVPFWVLSKCLTMGVIRDFYNILKPKDADEIAKKIFTKDFEKKRVNKLKNMIALLTDVRNMCAHDEMLAGFHHKRIDIGPCVELSHLTIKKDAAGNPLQGKKDLLAVFISIKYLVNRTMYNEFIQQIKSIIDNSAKQIKSVVTTEEFLTFLGLPHDYEILKKL